MTLPAWVPQMRRPARLIDRLAAPLDDLLQVVVGEAGIGMAVIDCEGIIVRVNDSLCRMVGDTHRGLGPGQPVADIFCADSQKEAWAKIAPAVQGSGLARTFTSMLCGPEGLRRTVTVFAVPLREADGAISGAMLQLSDITAQRRLEAQLLQSQKLQAVGQLAAGIAHDFNNLLTAVIGAAEEALERPLDPLTQEDLQQIRSSAERGADLVRQLLAFGRQQALQPQVLAINDTVMRVSALLRRVLGGKVFLELDLESPGKLVCVDPTQLDRVLINLAVNARAAMPEGGRLTLHTGHITLYRALVHGPETIPPGRYVMVEVQDTGIGIPSELLPRIFEPFFTTRREQGGSGLGLSTVHGIVRQSGGYLAVESEVGRGTRFRIYLVRHDAPAAILADAPAILAPEPAPSLPAFPRPVFPPMEPPPVAPALPTPPAAAACVTAGGRLILLVDDEDGVRRLAVRALSNRGWAVLDAESAEAALALLQEDPAHLAALCAVVSDVVMPGMDGPALVRAVRALRPGMPAILVSGYAEEAVRGDLAHEATLFLPKPYTLKHLAAALQECALPAS